MTNQTSTEDLGMVIDELYKIQALARAIPALIDALGTSRYPDLDKFLDDDMVPLAKLLNDAAERAKKGVEAMSHRIYLEWQTESDMEKPQ